MDIKTEMKTDALEERIYRYLLGDLPEEEQSALEQEFLADGDTFEQVWAAENELIDRYVRGKLTPAEKDLFEENYLASPVHRERLAFAKKLVEAADSGAGKEKTVFSTGHSFLAGWRASRLRWATDGGRRAVCCGQRLVIYREHASARANESTAL